MDSLLSVGTNTKTLEYFNFKNFVF